jgi:hypothetical protein
MPSIVRGNTITLAAQFVNSSDQAAAATSVQVDILDPDGATIVNNDTATATGPLGFYEYDYDVASDADLGVWEIQWSGIVEGQPVTGEEEFTVEAAGSIITSPGCPDFPLWMDPADLATDLGISVDEAEGYVAEATYILDQLTFNRYHGIECRTDEYMTQAGMCVIELDGFPVDEIFSVHTTSAGEPAEVTDFREIPGGRVRICCTSACDDTICHVCNDPSVIIQYRTQSNLPPGAARVVRTLASEFYNSATGAPCALPERITTVNRQGMSWTVLDPLDFLDQGLTGLGSVDAWISAVNRKGPIGMIDPLFHPPLMLRTLTGCGAACTGTEDV